MVSTRRALPRPCDPYRIGIDLCASWSRLAVPVSRGCVDGVGARRNSHTRGGGAVHHAFRSPQALKLSPAGVRPCAPPPIQMVRPCALPPPLQPLFSDKRT